MFSVNVIVHRTSLNSSTLVNKKEKKRKQLTQELWITTVLLDGKNYLPWHSVFFFLDNFKIENKRKLKFKVGKIPKPAKDDIVYDDWRVTV